MKDLTQGSIPKHLVTMAIPMMVGMLVQTLYFLVDVYFVGKLGAHALAGLSLASNAMFLIFALTQVLNVSTAALISHAAGAKDQPEANRIFNQSILLSSFMTLVVLALGYLGAESYLTAISNDAQSIQAGLDYLYWFIPCMAMQFLMVSIGAALRGTGIVNPPMMIQMISIVINIILSPILIEGWFFGYPMGIAGAGLASSVSVVCAVLMLVYYFRLAEKYINVDFNLWHVDLMRIKKLLALGLPAGGEFLLMFVYMACIYWLIQPFGADAQAGFGLGSRIMQSLFLPAMAIAFAAPAVAGQNFGAHNYQRVRQTFKWTAIITCAFMSLLTFVCLWQAEILLIAFTDSQQVLLFAAVFLQIICWNFVPSGLIFACSGMFQALGNTLPALFSTASRLVTFILPAIWLSRQPGFAIEHIWQLSVVTVVLQAGTSYLLLHRQYNKRLIADEQSNGQGHSHTPAT